MRSCPANLTGHDIDKMIATGHQRISDGGRVLMKIDGGCHCGYLEYTAEIDPDQVTICHCNDCQILSGSTFRIVVPVDHAKFHPTGGTPKIYVKTAASGNKRAQAFCPECGTQIYATAAEEPAGIYGLRVGTCHQRSKLPPRSEIWCDSRQGWLPAFPDLSHHAGRVEFQAVEPD